MFMENLLDFQRPQFTPVGGNTSIFLWDSWRRKWVPVNNIYHCAREKVTGERLLSNPLETTGRIWRICSYEQRCHGYASISGDRSLSKQDSEQGTIAKIPQSWKPALTYGGENHVPPFKWWLYNIIYECAPIPSMVGRVIIFSRSTMLSVHSRLKSCQP